MTDPRQPNEHDEDAARLDAHTEALLADPLLWEEPPPGLEDLVVAAIAAEAAAGGPPELARDETRDEAGRPRPSAGPAPSSAGTVSGLDEHRARRTERRAWVRPFAAGAAAAAVVAVLVLGGIGVLGSDDDGSGPAGVEVALAGTELAPEASAVADVVDTPQGTRIDLDVTGLEPAPDGTFYQAWLRQPGEGGEGVSAGTFHLRGGDGQIELWAGVTPDDYPLVTVTLQDEGAGSASSGDVVLRGTVG